MEKVVQAQLGTETPGPMVVGHCRVLGRVGGKAHVGFCKGLGRRLLGP